ncbi:MAG: 50S ribosomal protein L25 [Actinomycetota bacterium]
MQTVVKATLGRPTGSRASRRLRAEGRLPGVVYGLGKDPQPVAVDFAELRAALTGSAGMNAVFTLDLEGSEEQVLVRDVQRDPIRRVVTHADFLRIDPDQKVRVSVPIELIGEAKEVLEAGGLIEQAMFEIEVEVSPDAIPEAIEADLTSLTLDSRIAVADLQLPDGVITLVDEQISVVVPVVSRAAKMASDEEGDDLDELDETEAGDDGAEAAADEEE